MTLQHLQGLKATTGTIHSCLVLAPLCPDTSNVCRITPKLELLWGGSQGPCQESREGFSLLYPHPGLVTLPNSVSPSIQSLPGAL